MYVCISSDLLTHARGKTLKKKIWNIKDQQMCQKSRWHRCENYLHPSQNNHFSSLNFQLIYIYICMDGKRRKISFIYAHFIRAIFDRNRFACLLKIERCIAIFQLNPISGKSSWGVVVSISINMEVRTLVFWSEVVFAYKHAVINNWHLSRTESSSAPSQKIGLHRCLYIVLRKLCQIKDWHYDNRLPVINFDSGLTKYDTKPATSSGSPTL